MTDHDCKIKWNILSLAEWESRFNTIPYSTLCQSYEYAQGVCPVHHQRARWGIIEIGGREAGLVQIVEAGLFGNLLHGLHLDRGPLWFEGFGTAVHIKAFFEAFNREFPPRFGRKRRILPEVEHGAAAVKLLQGCGLKLICGRGYETLWIDLTQDVEILRGNMQKNWRNMIAKSEKAGLEITFDDTASQASSFLMAYQADQMMRGYSGMPIKLASGLLRSFGAKNKAWICTARLDNREIAAILVLCHGTSVTYQIGWSSEEGRKCAAHNLLLWRTMIRLKERGYRYFDLGGVNDESAKGIKRFKEGLGGFTRRYAGHYI